MSRQTAYHTILIGGERGLVLAMIAQAKEDLLSDSATWRADAWRFFHDGHAAKLLRDLGYDYTTEDTCKGVMR